MKTVKKLKIYFGQIPEAIRVMPPLIGFGEIVHSFFPFFV